MKPAITPGEILLEHYLIPIGISQNALARALGISPRSINEIVLGRRSITPEMSLKLGKFFKKSPHFGFNIPTTCDFRQLLKKEMVSTWLKERITEFRIQRVARPWNRKLFQKKFPPRCIRRSEVYLIHSDSLMQRLRCGKVF